MRPAIALVAVSPDLGGGQAIQARALLEGLRLDGYKVAFIPISPLVATRLRGLRRYPGLRTVVNQALYLPSLRRIRGADVVHVFAASYWSFLLAPLPAMLAARRLGKRVVLHYHSGEADDHLTRWRRLVRACMRLPHATVVPSEYLVDVFASHGYRVLVVPNVVDTFRYRYRERVPLRPRLLSTRHLERHYDVGNTLKAFAVLRRRYADASLVIAGGGREEARLHRLAASLGIDGVRFVGPTAPSAMARLYEEADIALNSSVVDNQPVSVLEAFAAGLPVVSTATGDIPNMVRRGESGLLVPARTEPLL